MFGDMSKEEINKGSTFGVGKALNRAVEKKEFRDAAKESDRGTKATGNLPNNDTRNMFQKTFGLGKTLQDKRADRMFEEKKAAEEKLAEEQMRINRANEAGLVPLKKQTEARDEAAKEVIEKTPALKKQFEPEKEEKKSTKKAKVEKAPEEEKVTRTRKAKVEKATEEPTQKTSNVIPFPSKTEAVDTKSIESANTMEKESESAAIKANDDKQLITAEHEMGSTLIQSLEVQKQTLAAITKMGEAAANGDSGSSGGSSMIETAADLAGNVGKKGGGMLSKAGKFLGKAGPGLLKGGVGALGGMALEAGGESLKENGYEKTGGAVSTLGTAASYAGTGAMIGSVIPGVGTAIGAGVGGAIGLGKGLYDNWGSMFGKKKEDDTKTTSAQMESVMGKPVTKGKPLDPDQMAQVKTNMEHGIKPSPLVKEAYDLGLKQPKMEGVSNGSAVVEDASARNEGMKSSTSGGGNTLVNAPTNNVITNTNSNTPSRSPVRNQESTMAKYIENRYA
jgi:hypothetical protein